MTEITEEIKETEVQQVNQDPPEETVGDIMQKDSSAGIKWLVIVVSALVYIAGLVYAEVHGVTMLQKGVAPDMRLWATMGMIAAGVSAVLFPIALQAWAIEAKHRLATILFYVLDFGFLAFNAFTDFDVNSGQQLAGWAQTYISYILPASPVIVAAMWAILWELDPSVKEKVQRLTLRMAMKEKMTRKVAEAAKGQNVTSVVNAAAQREVDRALTELFGTPVTGYVIQTKDLPQRKGLLQSFFDFLYSFRQPAPSEDTPTPSQRSDLSKEPHDNPKE
jgi:hypothetical protein